MGKDKHKDGKTATSETNTQDGCQDSQRDHSQDQEARDGFKVMDPFNWTKDKSIYQRWQSWSEKARLTLDAMEGDSEKTKISYFHHWINGEGMEHIESWKNSKTLISQSAYDELENKEGKYSSECIESYFTLFELLLAPKSNPLLAVEELHFAK